MAKNVQKTFSYEILDKKPIWIMRQAGRYLPEYKAVRSLTPNFMDFCFDIEKIVTVTHQPITRFNFDAAIIFSDILVIPHLLGQTVNFIENIGPVLKKINFDELDIKQFNLLKSPICESIKSVRNSLANDKSLFGFAGTPWTLASYMINREKINQDGSYISKISDDMLDKLLLLLTDVVANHLIDQIHAGCDIIQIFDSWAKLCPPEMADRCILRPLERIISKIREIHPDVPIVYYGRGVSDLYPVIESWGFKKLGFGLDETVDINWALKNLTSVLQGNFSNQKLLDGDFDDAITLRNAVKDHPFIFNLGHGILPKTPIAHVEKLLEIWRQ
jgi:uroporphyrinogen decarboxylase